MTQWRDEQRHTQVLLVRHGRTAVNAQGRLSGRHDPVLDELGQRQAAALGAAVAAIAMRDVMVVSSPLQRCVDTAREIAQALRTDGSAMPEVHLDDRFVEMDYGDWDGLELSEVPPAAWHRWRTDPEFHPPGGETLRSVTARVSAGLSDWAPRAGGGTLVVASHVSPIKAGVIWALGVDESASWRMRLDNASICRLAVDAGSDDRPRASLRSFNETAHLEGLS